MPTVTSVVGIAHPTRDFHALPHGLLYLNRYQPLARRNWRTTSLILRNSPSTK